jgi:hypothetical protein
MQRGIYRPLAATHDRCTVFPSAGAAAGRAGTSYLDSRDGVHANLRNQTRQRRLVLHGQDLDYAADHGYGVYRRATFYRASPSSAR